MELRSLGLLQRAINRPFCPIDYRFFTGREAFSRPYIITGIWKRRNPVTWYGYVAQLWPNILQYRDIGNLNRDTWGAVHI